MMKRKKMMKQLVYHPLIAWATSVMVSFIMGLAGSYHYIDKTNSEAIRFHRACLQVSFHEEYPLMCREAMVLPEPFMVSWLREATDKITWCGSHSCSDLVNSPWKMLPYVLVAGFWLWMNKPTKN